MPSTRKAFSFLSMGCFYLICYLVCGGIATTIGFQPFSVFATIFVCYSMPMLVIIDLVDRLEKRGGKEWA